ncbi:MAG TPA: Hsp20/alpha crystallin family protein [Vicinamibacterales bacterium]|nr:Hsp20/alpha crystallin family protein [Vicinamibacterales bacterium]
MAIVRWDPLRDLLSLQNQMNSVFGDVAGRPAGDDLLTRGSWVPAVDIFETPGQELVLKAELPEVKREAIQLTIDNGTLTLAGERKLTHEVKEESFQRLERSYGAFSRSFRLPATVDTQKVSADYKDGVLTVRLPRREEAKPKQIEVQTAA